MALVLASVIGLKPRARPTRVAGRDFRAPPTPPRAIHPTRRSSRNGRRPRPRAIPTLSNANVAAMKAAVKRYTDIVNCRRLAGRCPTSSCNQGMQHPAVELLRERLLLSGDLRERGRLQSFDFYVDKAVKRYQASNGLAPTGIVDKRTIAALNMPAESRLKQLKANLARLTEHSKAAGKRYVMVNIPAAQIEAVEGDRIVSRHAGVVGKPDRPTPILNSAIHELNFNAVWHLPPTVIEKDLIPKGQDMARRDESVLVKFNIDAYGGDGKKLDPNKINWSSRYHEEPDLQAAARSRQSPGLRENQLQQCPFRLYARHALPVAVRAQFSRGKLGLRAHSRHRATSLLGPGRPRLEAGACAAMKTSGERRDVTLKKPVPLYFVYITAWATEDGIVQFRRDLYQKDGIGATAAAY